MAEARLLRKKISKSERVNKLPDSAALLYTWMLGHLDVEGRFSGNPRVIKNTVIPLKSHSVATVDKWLDMMMDLKDDITNLGLIERYEVNGNQYLWYPGFAGEQSPRGGQAWKSWEPPSDIPAPPGTPESPPPEPKKAPATKQTSDDVLDPIFGSAIKCYGDNISTNISPHISDEIKMLVDELKQAEETWVDDAIKEAAEQGIRKLSYIKGILRDWHQEGKKSPKAKEKAENGRVQEYDFK